MPHATVKPMPTTSRLRPAIKRRLVPFPVVSVRRRVVRSVPKRPNPDRRSIAGCPYPPPGGVAAATTVRVDAVADAPGEMVAGANVQVNPVAGEQESVIWPLKPPTAAEPTVSVAVPPAATVRVLAERLREKSAPVAAAAGTRAANNPLVWLAPPAVK